MSKSTRRKLSDFLDLVSAGKRHLSRTNRNRQPVLAGWDRARPVGVIGAERVVGVVEVDYDVPVESGGLELEVPAGTVGLSPTRCIPERQEELVTDGRLIQRHLCRLIIDVEPRDAGAPVDVLPAGRRLHHDSGVRINPLDLKLSSD